MVLRKIFFTLIFIFLLPVSSSAEEETVFDLGEIVVSNKEEGLGAPYISEVTSQDIESNKQLNFSFRNVLAVTLSGISHLLHSRIEKIAKNAVPLTADDTLEDWAKVYGLFKKGESRASGEVEIRSFKKEKIQNLEFIAENGVSYFASNLSLEAGDNSVQVVCNSTGRIGNLEEAPLNLKTTHENIKTRLNSKRVLSFPKT